MNDYSEGPERLRQAIAQMDEAEVRQALYDLWVEHIRVWNNDYNEPNIGPGEAEWLAALNIEHKRKMRLTKAAIDFVGGGRR